jgi:hypothetical protein
MTLTRYIFTCSDIGGGCLKHSRIAQRVMAMGYELVHGPAPYTREALDFFAARTALWLPGTYHWEAEDTGTVVSRKLTDELELALDHDVIEIWIDPDPNGQLIGLQLIDWLGKEPRASGKLRVCFLDEMLGEQTPEAITSFQPNLLPVDNRILATATSAWSAFRQPTPSAWFELKSTDVGALPNLPHIVDSLLRELPDARNGLVGTQHNILTLVSNGFDTPKKLFGRPSWHAPSNVFGYWERGRLLCDLALCAEPALTGMNAERFTLDLHDSRNRHRAFFNGAVALTPFGRALLAGESDFAAHNRVDRWWGGTHLTNEHLWRWNPASRSLVPPS